ncbi:MAG: hypothetical protein QOH68_3748, partial [Nocardioidaceae bacterium]|nr:hypothetical protein [Nocardioidaceae bacterium]
MGLIGLGVPPWPYGQRMGDLTPGDRAEAGDESVDRADLDPPYVPGERPRNSWVAPGSSDVVQNGDGEQTEDESVPAKGRR